MTRARFTAMESLCRCHRGRHRNMGNVTQKGPDIANAVDIWI